ncbi:MAG: porin family protein [Methylocystis sp.]|nr:porin family protein [Methylocystis sp.]MCA3588886.1 porin family protein [Methylocystis sp.]MCA3590433.1 porin family protein [Methylocystis sp.]
MFTRTRGKEMSFRRMIWSAPLLLMSAGAAFSADLPLRPPPPVFAPTPAYNWTGFYVGVNAGYGWGSQDPLRLLTNSSNRFSYNTSGGMIGGTLGAQIQSGKVVMGLEGDLSWANITGNGITTPILNGVRQPFSLNLSTEQTALGTLRARVGYAHDNWLFYGTAGMALMDGTVKGVNLQGPCGALDALPRCNKSSLQAGITMGLGVEYGFATNWSAKAEYLYTAVIANAGVENLHMLRVGVNYRFGGN